jgi:hypothetical protein
MKPVYAALRNLGQRLINAIYSTPSVQVTPKRDRQGQIYSWCIYDPRTDRRFCVASEMEVRIWLDQQYFQ